MHISENCIKNGTLTHALLSTYIVPYHYFHPSTELTSCIEWYFDLYNRTPPPSFEIGLYLFHSPSAPLYEALFYFSFYLLYALQRIIIVIHKCAKWCTSNHIYEFFMHTYLGIIQFTFFTKAIKLIPKRFYLVGSLTFARIWRYSSKAHINENHDGIWWMENSDLHTYNMYRHRMVHANPIVIIS